jgi:di/tripeptidase
VHALATVITGLEELRRASGRSVAVNVGRVGGGTSINAIPAEAWLELDLRAEAAPAIAALESRARRLVDGAIAAHPPLSAHIELIGDRPGGALPADHLLVRVAAEATRLMDAEPELVGSSTDANVALALDLPALALGAGGDAGGTHTLAEWYHNGSGAAGIQRLVLVVAALDRLL